MNNEKKQLQASLISMISERLNDKESIGNVLIKVLGLNKDAVYRRIRLETDMTMVDLQKIKNHFDISIDAVLGETEQVTLFEYYQRMDFSFNIDSYLNAILNQLTTLSKQENPELIITVNNTPFFNLFNFPDLLKFKLFFWMKHQIGIPSFRHMKMNDFVFNNQQLTTIYEIAKTYTCIPTVELYDPEMFRGLAREIYFYHSSKDFFSPRTTIDLFNDLILLAKHMSDQSEKGYKYMFGKKAERKDCSEIKAYYNEVLNSAALFYYSTSSSEGLFMAQNFLNPIFTTNKKYISDTKNILNNMINSVTKISESGHKLRHSFFSDTERLLLHYKSKVLLDMEFEKNNRE